MSTNLKRIIDLSEKAKVQAAEVACLLEFLDEATLAMDCADCPSYINGRTLGTIQAATAKMAEQLAEQNEDLTHRLEELEKATGGRK